MTDANAGEDTRAPRNRIHLATSLQSSIAERTLREEARSRRTTESNGGIARVRPREGRRFGDVSGFPCSNGDSPRLGAANQAARAARPST